MDLDLAFWIIEHLSLCELLQPLSERYRFRLKEDIPRLQEEFNSVLPATVQFACKSWCLLVCRVVGADSRITGGPHPESDAYPEDPRPRASEDILNGIHPKSDMCYNLNAFCNELIRHSPEAEDARVTSILRYETGGRTTHRFLILHAVKKSGQTFFVRLDRRPRTQFKLASQRHMEANDHVGL